MSEGYDKGHYQNAQNINCKLEAVNHRHQTLKSLGILMYEFAPFANSTDFCLHTDNPKQQLICSGSKNIFTSYGPFSSTTGWQFNMQLGSNARHVPAIRFWMNINVSPNDNTKYYLQCNSNPVVITATSPQIEATTDFQLTTLHTSTSSESKGYFYPVTTAILGSFLMLLVLIVFIISMYWLKRSHTQPDISEQIYSDIDAASIDAWSNFPLPNIRTRMLVPEISLAMQAIDNLCHGSTFTIATQASVAPHLQRSLPRPNEIGSSDAETSEDVAIIDNTIYGSQMTDQSSDEESDDTEVVDNAIYGRHLHTEESSTSDGIEIEDNSIYGSHISMQGIHGDGNDTQIIENEMYGSHMQFIDKDPITADGEASQEGPEGDATTDEIIPDPRTRHEDVQENMPENTLDADKTNNPPVAENATSDMCDDDEVVDNTYL